jgi:hypothetical protein
MAELVPIKSFASPKGSNSGQAKPGPDSQPAIVARFAAINYARKLTEAPDGSRITSTEKNVLLHLALAFNSEIGIAWPGIETLCKDACICDRHCRRSVASLERKKVIQRIPTRRNDKSGQTSNEYFFPALGSPPQTPEARARRLEIQTVSRTPMTPMTERRGQTRPTAADTSATRTHATGCRLKGDMVSPFRADTSATWTHATGGPGQTRPTAADTSVRPARTNATGEPGHGRPPIESLGESLGDCLRDSEGDALAADLRGKGCQDVTLSAPSSAPAVRNRAANVQPAKSQKAISKNGKAPLADLGLARNAWNSAMEKVRSAYGANEFKKYRLRDVTVVSADEDGAGIVHLILRSPAPEKAEMGIAKHETVISQALCGFYGRTVKLRVLRDGPGSAPNDQRRIPSANAGPQPTAGG